MKTVTKTALANVRQNKVRNLISGTAIILTTLLVFMVLTVGNAAVAVRFAGVNAYYPPYHAMFRQVSEENVQKLSSHNDIEKLGRRIDLGEGVEDDSTVLLMYMDDTALELNRVELSEGTFPKSGNEIAFPEAMLEEYGLTAGIGDEITLPFQLYEEDGLGYQKEDTFRICGFLEGENGSEQKSYPVLVSEEYMEQTIPEESREYRVMFRLKDVGKNIETTDAIEEEVKGIGADFGVQEDNVVINTEYLLANYIDPTALFGIVCIVLVVVMAGVLTIYSIYYVSMVPKIQEYGKLKAMGATKRQIRQIVFREGLLVTAIALPLGLLMGSLIAGPVTEWIYRLGGNIKTEYTEENLNTICMQLLENGEVQILTWWIYLVTILTVVVTVYLSLVKPMRMAAKISPVEAVRYQGERPGKKQQRKGFQEMSLGRLTRAGLARNKRRSALTILTLGTVGILFMVVATVISCAAPKEIARQEFEEDYKIYVDSWSGDKMNPDREWENLMQNNPLTEEFISGIREVPGVEKVEIKTYLSGALTEIDPESDIAGASIQGLGEDYAKEMEGCQIEGHATYEELKSGDQILMSQNMMRWFPELHLGSRVKMTLPVGNKTVERTFQVAAIGDYPSAISWANFLLPSSVVEEIAAEAGESVNLNDACEIRVDSSLSGSEREETYAALAGLAKTSEYLETDSFEQHLGNWETTMMIFGVIGYAFLIILGAIGIMNLINTMINSIYTRRRELGMIQAIGMSEKQLVRMMQLEGLFYTAGTLLVSLGLGSLAGYGVFLYAKADGMLNIAVYHYPVVPAVALAVTVAVIQLLLTYAVARSFRRMSLIDRIRYAD